MLRINFDANCDLLRQALEKMPFIHTYGFIFEKEDKGNNEFGGFEYRITFFNRKNRRVNFLYTIGKQDKENIIISIEDNDNGFIVEDFITAHHIQGYKDVFDFFLYHGSFEKRIEDFLAAINQVIRTHLTDIIAGDRWEDVPFDWGGTK